MLATTDTIARITRCSHKLFVIFGLARWQVVNYVPHDEVVRINSGSFDYEPCREMVLVLLHWTNI